MEKYQTSGRLVIRRPCSVVSEEKKVSRLDSSYSVFRVGEMDNIKMFSLSRRV